METTEYDIDLTGKSLVEVADLIDKWREDESDSPYSEACDLLNSIEPWLRQTSV